MWPASGYGKIWILVPDCSRIKSSEPDAGYMTRKIGPLYFTLKLDVIYECSPIVFFFKKHMFWVTFDLFFYMAVDIIEYVFT